MEVSRDARRTSRKIQLIHFISNIMTTLDKNTTMGQLNSTFPGARRALFAKYHIGGCSSCAYEDLDTIESVANKNEFDLAKYNN